MTIFSRNELYWGSNSQNLLAQKHVAVFGLGGVGGFCAEMLARAGVGELTIVDFDRVAASNINRQIIALNSTIGQKKTALIEARLKDINPDIKINVINDFYTNKLNDILLNCNCPPPQPLPLKGGGRNLPFDFVADAIDSMRSKISLLAWAHKNGLPIVSSLGAGNRLKPEELYICDISELKDRKTPFVNSILYQMKKKNIVDGITFVASREKPFSLEKVNNIETVQTNAGEKIEFAKITPSSTPFVASCAGIFMASYIVRELIR